MGVVALRKESVDRNHIAVHCVALSAVALRKESVDRNYAAVLLVVGRAASLSARRAWIEINTGQPVRGLPSVALRKESVDRNYLKRRQPL